jgi:hypothetical protein
MNGTTIIEDMKFKLIVPINSTITCSRNCVFELTHNEANN